MQNGKLSTFALEDDEGSSDQVDASSGECKMQNHVNW